MKFARIAVWYMVKYLLGFLIVFVCSVMVFAVAKENIEGYVIEQVEMKTEEGIREVEETIEKVDLINRLLYQNKDFVRLLYQGERLPKTDVLMLKNSNDLLSRSTMVVDDIPYIFVLFKNNDLYMSSAQCSLSFSDYCGSFLTFEFPGEAEAEASSLKSTLFDWKTDDQNFQRMTRISYVKDNKQEQQKGLLYLSKGSDDTLSPLHVCCAVLPEEYLVESILMQEYEQEGFLYIENIVSGEVLISYGKVVERAEAYNSINLKEMSNCHVIESELNKLGWRIVTGVPKYYISKQMLPAQQLLMVYLTMGFIIVIGLTLYFGLARYYGFCKILFTFPKEEMDIADRRGFSDYKLLSQNVARLDEKRKAYRLQIEELKGKNQAILLENLLTKGIDTQQEQLFFREYFKHEPEFYCVVMVRFGQEELGNSEAVTIDIVDALLQRNIALLGNVHSGVSDELFLIELDLAQEGNTSSLQIVFEEIINELSEKHKCVLHTGISTVGTALSNIGKCYEQAKRMVQSLYLYENESKIQVYDGLANSMQENLITIEFLSRLYTVLICGKYTDAEKELSQIEGRYSRMPYLYEEHKEQIFWSLHNIFYTVMLHLNCADWKQHIPVFAQSLNCHEMMVAFKNSASWICDYIYRTKKSKNDNLRENILQYMNEHYMEPGLSAFTVSQQVGISEKYLFQFWKEQSGETFAASLLRIRINKSVEYLEQTDYSNEHIATLTGFASANTFYRNFQKLMGVTPKTYKEKSED